MKTEPFAIYEIELLDGGRLAISPQPNSQSDFGLIKDWAPNAIVTMTTQEEFPRGIELESATKAIGADWHHLPIADFGAPAAKDESRFHTVLAALSTKLTQGSRILIHCKGGQGRSGMMALRLLIQAGEAPDKALHRLRAIRPGAVETEDQLFWATKQG